MEYMSQEGYDKLVAELYQLEHVEYPKVKEALVEAREKGDLWSPAGGNRTGTSGGNTQRAEQTQTTQSAGNKHGAQH